MRKGATPPLLDLCLYYTYLVIIILELSIVDKNKQVYFVFCHRIAYLCILKSIITIIIICKTNQYTVIIHYLQLNYSKIFKVRLFSQTNVVQGNYLINYILRELEITTQFKKSILL